MEMHERNSIDKRMNTNVEFEFELCIIMHTQYSERACRRGRDSIAKKKSKAKIKEVHWWTSWLLSTAVIAFNNSARRQYIHTHIHTFRAPAQENECRLPDFPFCFYRWAFKRCEHTLFPLLLPIFTFNWKRVRFTCVFMCI